MFCSLLLAAMMLQDDPGIPSPIETLYVVEMSHCDIGFTDTPSTVAEQSYEHLVHALDTADIRPSFRWTIEGAWVLEQFLERASASERARLLGRFADGRFVLSTGYLDPHSGLCSEEMLHRFGYASARAAAAFGADIRTALLDDVPGFTTAMPRVLANSGGEFCLLGANDFVGGKPNIPLGDRPFWWEGRDGSRVLTWLTWGSYAEGYFDWGLLTLSLARIRIEERIREFEAAGYPFDAVLVMRGFDNADTGPGMADLAAQWNATYQNPKIRLATPDEFFEHLLANYGDVFPTYVGDASGMWESAATVTPASAAIVHRAQAALPAIEGLWDWLSTKHGVAYPLERFDDAWRYGLAHNEHSGGGPGWPGLLTQAQIDQQDREHVWIARACAEGTASLAEDATALAGPLVVPTGEEGLVLFNPLGDDFEGVVEIECGSAQPADLALIDAVTGQGVPFRWARADRSALAAHLHVPAHAWARWSFGTGGTTPPYPAESSGTVLTQGTQRLEVDPLDGTVISWSDTGTGTEYLDPAAVHRFAGIERGSNQKTFFGMWSRFDPSASRITVEEPSAVYRTLRVYDKRDNLMRAYRLFDGEARVDVELRLRRDSLPFVPYDQHSHHYGVALSANLPTPTRLELDSPDGWLEPGPESLPGAGLGHFGAPTGARLIASDGSWLSVSSLDSVLVDAGEMNGNALAAIETDEAALTWKLIRHASLSELQGGALAPWKGEIGLPDERPYRFVVRYGDGSQPPPSRERLRHDLAPPLAAWVLQGAGSASMPASGHLIGIQGPAELIAWKRAQNGTGSVVRLRAGAGGGTAVLTPTTPPSAAHLANLVEAAGSALPITGGSVSVPLTPNGVTTVLLLD